MNETRGTSVPRDLGNEWIQQEYRALVYTNMTSDNYIRMCVSFKPNENQETIVTFR